MQVYLCGARLETRSAKEICEAINYCPQKDTFWPRLTMRQILMVFSRLRGLSSRGAETLIDRSAEALRITSHLDKEFENLSGGTKRKVLRLSLLHLI